MQEVARFDEGELSYLVTQGTKTGNPGLPLTDNQKRQEATKKEQEVKSKKAAAAITSESHQRPAPPQTTLHPGIQHLPHGGPSLAKSGHKESA